MTGKDARPWLAAIAMLAVCAIAIGWYPLSSITALPAKNYNEGWNAYRQWMAFQGQPLYASRASFWTTNYPFLSFHIVGLLGGGRGNMVLAGRGVCFAALVAVALLTGAVVRQVTGARAGAVYAGLYLFVGLGAFNGDGRAVDDPELLSLAFAMLGVFAYLQAPRGVLGPALAAAAFAFSLFTKHDVIALPLSVAVHLLATSRWRGFGVFAAVGGGVSGLLLALSLHLDGPWFFAELLQPRAYGWGNLRAETLHYLLHFAVPMLLGVVVLARGRAVPARGFLLVLLGCSNLVAILFAGGDGVAANIFYPALLADVLACVAGICALQRGGRFFKAALAVCTLAGAVMVPFQLYNDIAAWRHLPAQAAAARQAVGLLAAAKGPVVCEDLLLCYEAGKAMDFDAYYVKDQILIGRVRQADVVALLAAHHYAAVQVDGPGPKTPNGRFTEPVRRALLGAYRPVLVSRYYSVFVPDS